MGKVTQLLDARQFQHGMLLGSLACGLVLLVASLRGVRARPAIAGIAATFASLLVLQGTGVWHPAHRLAPSVLIGVFALFAGGAAFQLIPQLATSSLMAHIIVLAPGGVILGFAFRSHPLGFVPWTVGVLAPTIGALASDFDAFHRRRGFGPAVLWLTCAGVYLTVPDTEGARALLGVTIPLIALVIPRPAATLGAPGIAAMTGIILAIAASEGTPRPGSIVGSFAAFGLLACEPIARRVMPELRGRDGHDPDDHVRNTTLVLVVQGIAVVWASRVAGFERSALSAAAISTVGFAFLMWASTRLPRPPLPDRTRDRTRPIRR